MRRFRLPLLLVVGAIALLLGTNAPEPPVSRLPVRKTYKLFIGGAFPRSESGRTYEADGQIVARASRKDAATRSSRPAGQPSWAGATAYIRGQVLYRIAEMMEARAAELAAVCSGREGGRGRDRPVVWYAGWADKLAQLLRLRESRLRPVLQLLDSGADRRRRVLAPEEPALAGLVSGSPRYRRRQRGRRRRVGDASARRARAGGGHRDRPTCRAESSTSSPGCRTSWRRSSPGTWT